MKFNQVHRERIIGVLQVVEVLNLPTAPSIIVYYIVKIRNKTIVYITIQENELTQHKYFFLEKKRVDL